MKSEQIVKALIKKLAGSFSGSLEIDLEKGSSIEIFKWFLASILFGARVSDKIMVNTYRKFEKQKILTPPRRILETDWDNLVKILDAAGYVRCHFKTATKLLQVTRALEEKYREDFSRLHDSAESSRDLERRLQELNKGIRQVNANIFLRELRGTWKKADPLPQTLLVVEPIT